MFMKQKGKSNDFQHFLLYRHQKLFKQFLSWIISEDQYPNPTEEARNRPDWDLQHWYSEKRTHLKK
jgi:hypothetical protein